eukprot:11163589-Lingulodinium_polyedra.AAC.1
MRAAISSKRPCRSAIRARWTSLPRSTPASEPMTAAACPSHLAVSSCSAPPSDVVALPESTTFGE